MRSVMVVGTTSHAGKSLLTTALCRIYARQGWRVAPFKGQNMSLNSYVTATGGEIGYAQAVQAWAAGVTPWVEMNPILLKPQGNMISQVILKGQVAGTLKATDYYQQFFDQGWQAIQDSLECLAREFDLLVCEGAGSPAEINLKHRDLTNMRVAAHLGAATLLVVDIDRGGAFAHVVGTLALLDSPERDLIRGIVINKFRGDQSLLDPGITWLEDYTGIPVLGVIPWLGEVLPAEDSLDLFDRPTRPRGEVELVVLRLPRIANFTDFDPLEAEPTVKVRYLEPTGVLGQPDAVIIPGSKTTLGDLRVLQETGLAEQLREYVASGGALLGICGGLQMLGEKVCDPLGVEGEAGEYPGLGLLPLHTTMGGTKIARQRQVNSLYPWSGLPVAGYELHHGRTEVLRPCHFLFDDPTLGVASPTHAVWSTYLHGIFDNGPWRRSWLNHLRQRRGLGNLPTGIANFRDHREVVLNHLADAVAEHLDWQRILPSV